MTRWEKRTYVCHTCDALIEYSMDRESIPLDIDVSQFTCICGGASGLLSVDTAILQPINERNEMYQDSNVVIPPVPDELLASYKQEMELRYGSEITILNNKLDDRNRRISDFNTNINAVRDYLVENYDELEGHADSIADILGVDLTKTTTFTVVATYTVEITHNIDEEPTEFDFSIGWSNGLEYNGSGDMEIVDSDVTEVHES